MSMREAERETQLRSHLREIDDRLEQAIRSRNEYVDYLRSKYPNLSAERFETAEERSLSCGKPRGVHRIITRDPGNPDPFAQSMLILTPQEAAPSRLRDELRTNVYHWDLGRRAPPPRFVTPPGPLPRVSDPIPSNGLVLQSDLPRIRARLAEIKSDLADLRDQRMFMSSADYHRTILPSREPFLSTLNALQGPQGLPGDSYNQYAVPKRSDRSFAEILNRLTEITEETPTEEVPPPRALLANPNSHRDTQIDRMFEKVRGQVEDTVDGGREPLSPPRRAEKKEPEDVFAPRRTSGVHFEDTKTGPAANPPSYGNILAAMEQPRRVDSSESDSDDDVPPPTEKSKSTSAAPTTSQDDFLARFLTGDKKPTPLKTAPPIDIDDDDFY